jgi:hypothetical protein
VGNSLLPLRLGPRTEVLILDLMGAEEGVAELGDREA